MYVINNTPLTLMQKHVQEQVGRLSFSIKWFGFLFPSLHVEKAAMFDQPVYEICEW